VVGSIGLHYVCYRLAREGWNVMPTTRNARGVDAVVYSQSGRKKKTVQVKALSKRSPVPMGASADAGTMADFLVVCLNVQSEKPECFVLRAREIPRVLHEVGGKDDRSCWLETRECEAQPFREAWHRIGRGDDGRHAVRPART
jgi:hypothetical protein